MTVLGRKKKYIPQHVCMIHINARHCTSSRNPGNKKKNPPPRVPIPSFQKCSFWRLSHQGQCCWRPGTTDASYFCHLVVEWCTSTKISSSAFSGQPTVTLFLTIRTGHRIIFKGRAKYMYIKKFKKPCKRERAPVFMHGNAQNEIFRFFGGNFT